MAQSFIFGGNTPWTYEQLQRKREIADAMQASLGTPRNVGEGLAAIGKALAIRGINKRADARDAELKSEFDKKWGGLFGGGMSAGGGASYAPPVEARDPAVVAAERMYPQGSEPVPHVPDTPEAYHVGKPVDVIPEEVKNGIFAGESGGDYNALFGFSNRPGGAFAGTNLTDMTVDQALAFADPNGPYGQHVKGQVGRVATPMGAYQVVGSTLRAAKDGLGLTGNERMTPELQDRIAGWIYQTQGTGAWEGYRGPQSGGGQPGVMRVNALDIGTLAEVAGSPYATPGQKAIAQALMQQSMQAYDPAYNLDLENKRLQNEQLRQKPAGPKPIDVGGVLLDPITYEPIFDSRTPKDQKPIEVGGVLLDPSTYEPIYDSRAPKDTRTDDQREYEFAKSQGFQGSLQDWILSQKKAGASVNNVTVGGEGSVPANDAALRKKLGEKEGEVWSSYLEAGTVSAGTVQDMQMLDEILPMAPQGPISGRLAGAFPGINSAADAFNSIVKRVAPTLRAPGSGSTSDIEYDGMLKSLPQLAARPEANRAIAAMMKAKAQINVQRAEIVRKAQNDEISIKEARRMMSELDQQSIMTPELKAILGEMAPASDSVDGYTIEEIN